MDDLFKALQMFQSGVKDLAFSSALNQANEQVQQIKANVTNEAEQRAALHQVSQGLVGRMAGLGVPATTIAQVAQSVGPSIDPLTAQENALKREDTQLSKKMAFESSQTDKQLGMQYQIASMNNATELRKAGASNEKPTADQFKVGGFGKALLDAENTFDLLTKSGFDRASAGTAASSIGPNRMKSGALQRQEQAERSFVNAYLRRVSGAAISDGEFASAELQYFPRSGDDEATLKQKALNRQAVIQSFKQEAGPVWSRLVKQEPKWLAEDSGGGVAPLSAPGTSPRPGIRLYSGNK